MPCGLSDDELTLLHYLYAHRNLGEKRSRSILAIRGNLEDRIPVDEIVQSLMNKGYLSRKRKKDWNYWAIAGKAKGALIDHGYQVERVFRL